MTLASRWSELTFIKGGGGGQWVHSVGVSWMLGGDKCKRGLGVNIGSSVNIALVSLVIQKTPI